MNEHLSVEVSVRDLGHIAHDEADDETREDSDGLMRRDEGAYHQDDDDGQDKEDRRQK